MRPLVLSFSPPGTKERDRFVAVQWPVGALVFEKHAKCLTDGATLHPEEFHHVFAVEVRSLGFALFFEREFANANLEFVDAGVERSNLVRMARGAVAAHELVEVAQQVSGVACIASNGRVFPPVLIAVETSAQTNESTDVFDQGGFVAQRGESSDSHTFAYGLMVVKGDLPIAVATSGGLAHVVQKSGQPKS